MKQIALIILLFVSLTINGLQINYSSNYYRYGDMLEKKQVAVKDFCLNANNGVWSLEDADISKKSYQTEYTTETDTIMMLERGNRTYYNIGNGAVSIIGSENPQELIIYDMPETWRDVTGLSPSDILADDYQYWEELSDSSKLEVIKSLNIDVNVSKLYLHQIMLSDDSLSEAILDTLCMPSEGNKRMLYFYLMNEIIMSADGSLAEVLGGYCYRLVVNNPDFILVYLNKNPRIANEYITMIATELYYNDYTITNFKNLMAKSVQNDDYLQVFCKKIECKLLMLKNK